VRTQAQEEATRSRENAAGIDDISAFEIPELAKNQGNDNERESNAEQDDGECVHQPAAIPLYPLKQLSAHAQI
jgi:hypothetical protein